MCEKGYSLRQFYHPGAVVYNSRRGRHEVVLEFTHCIPTVRFSSGWNVLVQVCNSRGVVWTPSVIYRHANTPLFLDFAGTLGRIRGV